MSRELTLKRQRFVKELPTAPSVAEAARRAGYSPVSAAEAGLEALRDSKVQEALKAEVASLAEKSGVTPEWALKHLKANVERSMQAVSVLDHEGNSKGEYQYQPNAVNKGVELALKFNKLLGDDEKPSKEGDTYNQVVLQGFTIEQLRTMLEAVKAKGDAANS